MRIVFFFILIFATVFCNAQFTNNHPQSSSSTLETFNGGVKVNRGFINSIYPDTTTANANPVDFYPASQIFVNDTIYLRDVTGTRWIKQGISGLGSGTLTNFSAGNLSPLFTTSVANSTTTPALTFALSTQTANTVFAGPATGSAATPTFRTLVAADISGLVTASQGLLVSGLDVRLGGPIGSPTVLTSERNIKFNRQILHLTDGLDAESGGSFWQFSKRPYSPLQVVVTDTLSSDNHSIDAGRPLSTTFFRRNLYYPAGVYKVQEMYGHYMGLTFNFQDTMVAYTSGGDYNQPFIAEYRISPRNNGYSVFRTGHGTGTNLRRQEGVAAMVANMYVDGKDDATTDTIHVNGTLVGVAPYLVAALGSGKIRIDNVVYVQPNDLLAASTHIDKSFLFAPAVTYGTSLVDSAFGWFDTTRIVRSYHAGNFMIGTAASSWSSSNQLVVNGTSSFTGLANYATNIAGSYAARSLVDKNYVDSSIAAGGGGDVFKVGTPINNQVGIWTGDGTIEGDANLTFASSTLNIGVASASTGILTLSGVTSGTITIQPASAAGTYTLTLPTNDGDADQFLQTNGSGVLIWATASGGSSLFPTTGTGTATGTVTADIGANTLNITGTTGSAINYTADSHTFNAVNSFTVSIGGENLIYADIGQFRTAIESTDQTANGYIRSQSDLSNTLVNFSLNTTNGTGNPVTILGDGIAKSITYTADTHTFTGSLILNGSTSGTITLASDALSNVMVGTNLSGIGYTPFVQSIIVRSDETLANSNADQNLFATTHDVITVQANTTYEFYITGDFTHGAVAHSIALGFTPTTATVTAIEYNAYAWVTAVGTATASQVSTRVKATTTTIINISGANGTETFEARGTITIGATGGTITPQIKFSADPTGTVLLKTGARMEIWPVGNDTFIVQGNIN